jgi:hypothetical protein
MPSEAMRIFDFRRMIRCSSSIFDQRLVFDAGRLFRVSFTGNTRGSSAALDPANRKSKIENRKFRRGFSACTAALVLLSACQNVPRYKRASGKFDEWSTYQGKNFSPSSGTVLAVDTAANTITIKREETSIVCDVTPKTRITHEAADITLAQLPLNQAIKFTLAGDGKTLLTVWYGIHINASTHAGHVARKH